MLRPPHPNRKVDPAQLDWNLPDAEIARACEAWNALDRYVAALEDLRRHLPQPYRPLKDPWRTSGLASRREVWADRQDEATAPRRGARAERPAV